MAGPTGKNKKYGRNADWCKAYASRHQDVKNKVRKMLRHFKAFPNDVECAKRILHHDKNTPHYGIGADIRALCVNLTKEASP